MNGKFSEKHPKFTAFLKEAGQDVGTVLDTVGDLTGMKLFNLAGGILDKVSGLSPEQKEQAKQILQEEIADNEVNDAEVTKRLQVDMASDNKLSKNIRPLMLIYLTIFVTLLIVLDSSNIGMYYDLNTKAMQKSFNVPDLWKNLLAGAWTSALLFYFGSRGWEKIKTITSK